MDRFIRQFAAQPDDDLMLCPEHGVAYQRDMTVKVAYDESYFNKCLSYEDQEIARAINAGRVALVDRYAGADSVILDIGIGSGEFIKKRRNTLGYDVNPTAVAWLKTQGLWSGHWDGYHTRFAGFTFWDVIEHVEEPEDYFRWVKTGGFVFVSLPVFGSLTKIRASRHYRPGEHLYYWTEGGFVAWMRLHGFMLLGRADYETRAGRDSIVSFAFRRDGGADEGRH